MHALVPELVTKLEKKRIDRREFMRLTGLLGVSAASAALLAGLPAPLQASTTPKRGGELVVGSEWVKLLPPHEANYIEHHIYRNICEFLAIIDENNVTRPFLLEKWVASDDLKTWDLVLNKGIHFSHGPELTADDVIYNFKELWMHPDTTSTLKRTFGAYLKKENIEKIDRYTVRLKLDSAQIIVPEHLAMNQAAILPKDYDGKFIENPVGTGPYKLAEYIPKERCVLKRREGYWRDGVDGKALPYLDGIRFVQTGGEVSAMIAALSSGQVHINRVQPSHLDLLKGTNVVVGGEPSGGTQVIRMRADKAPFDNVKVRQALKAAMNRHLIFRNILRGYGEVGNDFHVSPVHPEYANIGEAPKQNIALAKKLLAEAGYSNGLDITLTIMNSDPYPTMAQILKANFKQAGINCTIEMVPSSVYWDRWMDIDFGITSWGPRPLGIQVLNLAYKTGGPWNETHWSNPEFDKLLEKANTILNAKERSKVMAKLERIMLNEGPIMIPYWNPYMYGHSVKVKNYKFGSDDLMRLDGVWLD